MVFILGNSLVIYQPVLLVSAMTHPSRVNEAANAYVVEKLEPGYENMDHYKVDFNAEERALSQLDFVKSESSKCSFFKYIF